MLETYQSYPGKLPLSDNEAPFELEPGDMIPEREKTS